MAGVYTLYLLHTVHILYSVYIILCYTFGIIYTTKRAPVEVVVVYTSAATFTHNYCYYYSLIGRKQRAAVGWKRVSRERETNDRQKVL
jgi:hypothetical protein